MNIKDGLRFIDLDEKKATYNSIDIMEGDKVIFTVDYNNGMLRVSGNSTLKLNNSILDSGLSIDPVASNVVCIKRQVYKQLDKKENN